MAEGQGSEEVNTTTSVQESPFTQNQSKFAKKRGKPSKFIYEKLELYSLQMKQNQLQTSYEEGNLCNVCVCKILKRPEITLYSNILKKMPVLQQPSWQ